MWNKIYIGDQRIMLSDNYVPDTERSTSLHLTLTFDNDDEVKKAYEILKDDCTVITPLGEKDLKIMLASKLYEARELSLGQAADVAGLSKRTFIEILGQYGVSLFTMSSDELREDIANA